MAEIADQLAPFAPAAPEQAVLDPLWRRWLALFILLGAGMLTSLAFTSVVPGLQKIAAQFPGGDSILSAQFVVTMAPVGLAVTGPFAGWIISKLGLRRSLYIGLTLTTLAGTCQLWVATLPELLASRFLLGCALMLSEVSLSTMIGARYAGPVRARLIGFRGGISSTCTVISMLLSGYLVQTFGWRTPGYMFLLPLLFLALSLITFNKRLEQADIQGGEARVNERFSLLQLWPIYLLSFVMSMAHTMPSFQLPFLLKDLGVTSAIDISRVPSLSAFISVITALCFGLIYARLGRVTFVLASLLMGLGFVGMGLAPSYGVVLVFVILEGIGAGTTLPFFSARVLDRVTAAQRGQALGFMMSAVFIGHFFNPIVIKPIRDAFGIHQAFVIVGGFLIIAGAAMAVRAWLTRGRATIV